MSLSAIPLGTKENRQIWQSVCHSFFYSSCLQFTASRQHDWLTRLRIFSFLPSTECLSTTKHLLPFQPSLKVANIVEIRKQGLFAMAQIGIITVMHTLKTPRLASYISYYLEIAWNVRWLLNMFSCQGLFIQAYAVRKTTTINSIIWLWRIMQFQRSLKEQLCTWTDT